MSSFLRTIAFSLLICVATLAGPMRSMAADSVTPVAPSSPPSSMKMHPAGGPKAHAMKETVEHRIARLHASLKITPDEETNWNGVATAMRDNAVVMHKLIAERSAKEAVAMTAVDDLKAYEKFAQAHVDGLKSLTSSFATLYAAMPDAQKKIADDVFRKFGREAGSRS